MGDPTSAEDLNHALQNGAAPANAYHQRGLVRLKLADNKGALADFDAAIAANPDFAAAYFKRSKLRTVLGDQEGADADSQWVTELTSHFSTATETTGRTER
jgi:tetratricopeptide (TPR) repeat protein